MLGVLRFSLQLLDHLSPEMADVVYGFVNQGKIQSTVDCNGERRFHIDHPDFTEVDFNTEYMLYLGNRFNRATQQMEPRILHLDKIGERGKLIPVKYYV